MPSGKRLSTAMAAEIAEVGPGPVVELGGGTGSITSALLEGGVAPQDLFVVEREAAFAAMLTRRFPEVRVIGGDARDLRALLRQAGVTEARAVVSGLPLLSLPDRTCREILSEVFGLLDAGGRFVQFTYGFLTPLRPALADQLGVIGTRSTWVLENLPPAFVWSYRHRAAEAA